MLVTEIDTRNIYVASASAYVRRTRKRIVQVVRCNYVIANSPLPNGDGSLNLAL